MENEKIQKTNNKIKEENSNNENIDKLTNNYIIKRATKK